MKQAARLGQIITRFIGCLIVGAAVLAGTAAGVAGPAPAPVHIAGGACGLPWGAPPCQLRGGGPSGTPSVT